MTASSTPVHHGVSLRFFMHTDARHDGMLLSEWLLELARHEHLAGGSAFRAIAGFGRHGVLREEAFFELAGKLPVVVEFVLDDADATRLLERVRAANVELVYTRTAIEYGVLGRTDTK
ncbi:MAG TPA: DUF190 domain-containing protein [Oleiagrimonas sp.]|nr:DUF190 domain-containing protein [Oleiagrimonas sp.]